MYKRQDILFGIELGFDFIAASFVSSANDLIELRRLLDSKNCHTIRIISKIESEMCIRDRYNPVRQGMHPPAECNF